MTGSIFEPSRYCYSGYRSFKSLPLVTGICSKTLLIDGRVPHLILSLFNPANALAVSAFCSFHIRR